MKVGNKSMPWFGQAVGRPARVHQVELPGHVLLQHVDVDRLPTALYARAVPQPAHAPGGRAGPPAAGVLHSPAAAHLAAGGRLEAALLHGQAVRRSDGQALIENLLAPTPQSHSNSEVKQAGLSEISSIIQVEGGGGVGF